MRKTPPTIWTTFGTFWPICFVPTTYLAETKMSQQKNNQKVACNMSNLPPILVSIFSFLLLPTGSPLMKLGQVWPLWPLPDHTKCFLTLKCSPQPSIHIFWKSKKNWQSRRRRLRAGWSGSGLLLKANTSRPLLLHLRIFLPLTLDLLCHGDFLHFSGGFKKP